MIFVQSPTHVLKHFLPYPVDKEKGKAQFDSDKGILSVTLPTIRKTIFDDMWVPGYTSYPKNSYLFISLITT